MSLQKRIAILAVIFSFVSATLPGWVRDRLSLWPDGKVTVLVGLGDSPVYSDGLSPNQAAIQAIQSWNEFMGRLQLEARSATFTPTAGNGSNEVFFGDTVYGEEFNPGVLAIALSRGSAQQRLESDIIVNRAIGWDSYRGSQTSKFDLKRVIIHESGHLLGLSHPDEAGQPTPAIMRSTINYVDAQLDDDKEGIGELYGYGTGYQIPPIVFTRHPQNTSLYVDYELMLSAQATGRVTSLQWEKDGANVPGATSGVLSIPKATLDDSGSYVLVATGPRGTVRSEPAVVTVTLPPPPVFTELSTSRTVREFETFDLHSRVNTAYPVSLQWFRNGAPLPAAEGGKVPTHIVKNATAEWEGEYFVEYTNRGGTTRSDTFTIKLQPETRYAMRPYFYGGRFITPGTVERISDWMGERATVSVRGGLFSISGYSSPFTYAEADEGGFVVRTRSPNGDSAGRGMFVLPAKTNESTAWLAHEVGGDIAYFILPSTSQVERYDLENSRWLDPLAVPSTVLGVAAKATHLVVVAQDGVRIYDHTGALLRHIARTLSGSRAGVSLMNGRIFVATDPGFFTPSTTLACFDLATGALLAERRLGTDWSLRFLALTAANRLVSANADRKLVSIEVASDGSLSLPVPSDQYLILNEGLPPAVHPDGSVFIDARGIVWDAITLAPRFTVGIRCHTAGFLANGDLTLLQGRRVLLVEPNGDVRGHLPLPFRGNLAVLNGEKCHLFGHPDQPGRPRVDTVLLKELVPTPPGGDGAEPPGPVYADDAYVGHDGTLYLISVGQGLIRTLHPDTLEETGEPRFLDEGPASTVFDSATDNLWILKQNGRLVTLRLSDPHATEQTVTYVPTSAALRLVNGFVWVTYLSNDGRVTTINLAFDPASRARVQNPNPSQPDLLELALSYPNAYSAAPSGTHVTTAEAKAGGRTLLARYANGQTTSPNRSVAVNEVIRKVLTGRNGEALTIGQRGGGLLVSRYDENLNRLAQRTFVGRAINISTLADTGSGAGTLTSGFYLTGDSPKRILIRSVGPGLRPFGVGNPLADPLLQLFDAQGRLLTENDDWQVGAGPGLAALVASAGAFAVPDDSKDAVIMASLAPGAPYTAIASSKDGTVGSAINEIYDIDRDSAQTRLINISSRTELRSPSGRLTAGFVLLGDGSRQVLIRGIGPSLQQFGVSNVLSNPKLTLFNKEGRAIARNLDWHQVSSSDRASLDRLFPAVGAFALPNLSQDAALLVQLPPGQYTAQLESEDGSVGNAMIEVYEVNVP